MTATPLPPSVRLALPREVDAIVAVQRAAYAQASEKLSPTALEFLDNPAVREGWLQAISRPPVASLRVLVAVDGGEVVGYAIVGPCEDEDARENPAVESIGELAVAPERRGQGHGSRLLAAAVDTMRADGAKFATTWVRSDDDALRKFLVGAGFGPDGAYQELGTEDERVRVKMVRLATAL